MHVFTAQDIKKKKETVDVSDLRDVKQKVTHTEVITEEEAKPVKAKKTKKDKGDKHFSTS